MFEKEITEVLKMHKSWLDEKENGVRADLCGADLCHADLCGADLCGADLHGADLCHANLRNANLRGADLDFSCWPLWCGSLDVCLDKRQKRQLLYHLLSVAPEYQTDKLIKEANLFHRVGETPALEMRTKP